MIPPLSAARAGCEHEQAGTELSDDDLLQELPTQYLPLFIHDVLAHTYTGTRTRTVF